MQLFADLTFHVLIGIHLCTFIVLHGYFSLSVRPVDQQRRQLPVRFYPTWCYVRSGVDVSARRIGSAMNRFNTNLIFFDSEDKFRGHFNLQNTENTGCSQMHNRANRCKTETQRTVNEKLLFSSFICLY